MEDKDRLRQPTEERGLWSAPQEAPPVNHRRPPDHPRSAVRRDGGRGRPDRAASRRRGPAGGKRPAPQPRRRDAWRCARSARAGARTRESPESFPRSTASPILLHDDRWRAASPEPISRSGSPVVRSSSAKRGNQFVSPADNSFTTLRRSGGTLPDDIAARTSHRGSASESLDDEPGENRRAAQGLEPLLPQIDVDHDALAEPLQQQSRRVIRRKRHNCGG